MKDFNEEMPMYLNNKLIFNIIKKLKLKKGINFFSENLIYIYSVLIKKKILKKKELYYLKAWIKDFENIKKLRQI